MAKFAVYFLLIISLLSLATPTYSAVASEFIKSSCNVTLYPDLCIQSLKQFSDIIQQSPKQMAQVALSVSVSRARSAQSFVKQMRNSKGMEKREHEAVQDCVENMGDSVDRLRNSISEFSDMGREHGESFMWHMNNVQTWVSAALTDEDTCLDGFAEGAVDEKIKAAIKGRIAQVARVTSNALALVNLFADRH